MVGSITNKDIILDCSINRFVNCGIPKELAIVFLSHLYDCIGNENFKFKLVTDNVFGNITNGFEEGIISNHVYSTALEPPRKTEDGGICLAFLFFSNTFSIQSWIAVPRRGEAYDYTCVDSQNGKFVVEVGGRTTKYGARHDLKIKKERFRKLGKTTETIYISSVGFKDGEHFVHRYN